MTRFLKATVFLAVFAAVAAAQIKNVAVVETELDASSGASAGITSAEVRQVTAELRREAVKNLPSNQYNIMTSETVQAQGSAVLEECAEENCVIALGSKIGADYIVRGIISKLRSRFTLSVEVYETENGNLVASSAAVRSDNVVDLVEKAAPACADMYEKFVKTQGSKRKKAEMYTIMIRSNPAQGGSVLRNPNQEEYVPGTSVDIVAVPEKGYAFTGWSGASADTAIQITVTMDDNKMLIANFKAVVQKASRKRYTLTTKSNPPEGGSVSRFPDYKAFWANERVTVKAAAAQGYKFADWSIPAAGGGYDKSSMRESELTVTMLGDATVAANFKRISADIYFDIRYQTPLGMPSLWGGVELEFGQIYWNGVFWGINLGGGGEERNGMLLGGGLSAGYEYDLVDRLQVVAGGSAGAWYVVDAMPKSNVSSHKERTYLNVFAPFIKLRRGFIEYSYRGLLGVETIDNKNEETGKTTTEYKNFNWNNHQVMIGFHLAGAKRWRKPKP